MIITNFLLDEIKSNLIFFNIIFCFYFEENKIFSLDGVFYFIFIFKNLGLIFYKKFKNKI